jgi:hypothetical protein
MQKKAALVSREGDLEKVDLAGEEKGVVGSSRGLWAGGRTAAWRVG